MQQPKLRKVEDKGGGDDSMLAFILIALGAVLSATIILLPAGIFFVAVGLTVLAAGRITRTFARPTRRERTPLILELVEDERKAVS